MIHQFLLKYFLGKAASCGDNMIKIHELNDLKETSNVITLDDERGLDHMDWSEDGQLLAVSTAKVRDDSKFFFYFRGSTTKCRIPPPPPLGLREFIYIFQFVSVHFTLIMVFFQPLIKNIFPKKHQKLKSDPKNVMHLHIYEYVI